MSYHFLGIPEVRYGAIYRSLTNPPPKAAQPIRIVSDRYNRPGKDPG